MASPINDNNMLQKIMDGKGFGGPVNDVEIATQIVTINDKIKSIFKDDFKDKDGQTARSLCSQLHGNAIVWSQNPGLPWHDAVSKNLKKLGEQLQKDLGTRDFNSSTAISKKINLHMYGQ